MEEILISVIIPIYYGKKYIEKQINQLEDAADTFSIGKIEVLFINDAPDEVLPENISSEYMDIRVFKADKNLGTQGARVRGLSYAKGEYVHFLDQDDEIAPDFYASQLQALGDADVVFCKGYNGNRQIYTYDRIFETVAQKDNLLLRPPVVSPGQALIRRKTIPLIWRQNILHNIGSDDYFLWLCMLSEGKRFTLNDRLLFRHVINGGNLSTDILRLRASDEEMVEILLGKQLFAGEDAEKVKEIPEKQFRRKYLLQTRGRRVMWMLVQLLSSEEKGLSLAEYLAGQGIRSVGIYGAATFGERIAGLLKNSAVTVQCFIDRNAPFMEEECPVFLPEEAPDDVDAVLISLVSRECEIRETIGERYAGRILTIREIVGDMMTRVKREWKWS